MSAQRRGDGLTASTNPHGNAGRNDGYPVARMRFPSPRRNVVGVNPPPHKGRELIGQSRYFERAAGEQPCVWD
jgi:hypothetical protein